MKPIEAIAVDAVVYFVGVIIGVLALGLLAVGIAKLADTFAEQNQKPKRPKP